MANIPTLDARLPALPSLLPPVVVPPEIHSWEPRLRPDIGVVDVPDLLRTG